MVCEIICELPVFFCNFILKMLIITKFVLIYLNEKKD